MLTLTKENFAQETAGKTMLIDFWAPWCGPCRMLSPVLDEIADECRDVAIGKVNIDEQPELAQQFSVMSIPTLVVLEDGAVRESKVGLRPKESILGMLQS